MTTSRIELNWTLVGLEWIARLASITSITLLVVLFIGEAFNPSQIGSKEWVGLLFFPIGVVTGMVIAWWNEGLGGVVTVASLALFYLVYGYLFRNHIGGWWFVTFAAPGLLFLLHWALERFVRGTPESRSRKEFTNEDLISGGRFRL